MVAISFTIVEVTILRIQKPIKSATNALPSQIPLK